MMNIRRANSTSRIGEGALGPDAKSYKFPEPNRGRSRLRLLALGLGFLVGAIIIAYPLIIRSWQLTWGATEQEVQERLPGDELVPNPVLQSTRAITIKAPAEKVWPWLVQMGQGRGGLYSYDWLENLVGCDIHSVDRIVPELQDLKVGDTVRMVPDPYVVAGMVVEGGPRFTVAAIQPDRALVLQPPREDIAQRDDEGKYDSSWAFVLEPVDSQSTRLLSRWRSFSDPAWMAPIIGVEPIAFVMEREMLRGIKARVEATTGS